MQINTDDLKGHSIDDLKEAKKRIDDELTRHLKRLAEGMGIELASDKPKRGRKTRVASVEQF